MNKNKIKLLLTTLFIIVTLFFSNDFGLIDIERTAIITALAIDYTEDNQYEVTTQIAVPEATDANTESKHAQIAGKGGTIAGAIKNVGDVSGWYPNMSFCNLLIISRDMAKSNVLTALDFFSKTLRLQDSALVVMANEKAKDLLYDSTPLDDISSFALQKIIIKNAGFKNDVVVTDIKNFCTGYYSSNSSSYMPIITTIKQSKESESGGGNSSSNPTNNNSTSDSSKNNTLFTADTTALFKDGIMVGELDKYQSFTFNLLKKNMRDSIYELYADGDINYLLTINKNKRKIQVKADENELKLIITLDLYCKVGDHNAPVSDSSPSSNQRLPLSVKQTAKELFTQKIYELIETERQTACDFLNIKQEIYKKNFKFYNTYKDNYLSQMKLEVGVNIYGQE